jgi:hypothetical protein
MIIEDLRKSGWLEFPKFKSVLVAVTLIFPAKSFGILP